MPVLQPGTEVRVQSSCGPCLTRTKVVRVNRVTVSLTSYGKQPIGAVHTEPCQRCEDHQTTSYPHGYTN